MSLVAFAEAHVVLGNGKEAEELAKQAVPLFQQLGDQAALDVVEQIASSARILQRRPPQTSPMMEGGPQGAPRSPAAPGSVGFRQREMRATGADAGDGGDARLPFRNKRAFGWSSNQLGPAGGEVVSEPAAASRQPARAAPAQPASAPTPAQRPPLAARAAGSAAPARPAQATAPATEEAQQLQALLRSVRRDWTAKDVAAVQQKLLKIEIASSEELFKQLRLEGPSGMNKRLKAAGQTCLKAETWEALGARGEK